MISDLYDRPLAVHWTDSCGLFGLRITALPDFLADHTLLGDTPEGRLAECCRRWEYLLGSLWNSSPGLAYSLRFTHFPDRGITDLILIGRMDRESDDVTGILVRSLGALRIPAVPLEAKEVSYLRNLSAHFIFEVRQAEQLFTVPGEGVGRNSKEYLVLPWWGPGGSFQGPASSLAQGSSPVTLAVVLQPTTLDESAELADLSMRMATAATRSRDGMLRGEESASRVSNTDPQAEWLGRVHAANLRRLHRPFLITAYTASNDRVAARAVADALAAAIGDERPFEPPIGETNVLPSRADVLELEGAEGRDALQAINELDFTLNGPTLCPAGKTGLNRLRYLCDARGAASAFRLPVSVNGGIPGIAVRQYSPDFLPGPKLNVCPDGHIELGKYEDGGLATIPVADLCKHALVTGFTGSGKTVTVLQLLHQLWADHHVPFLVLESAKREYRGLLGVEAFKRELRVYTLGNENGVPFRLNPFELLPGVRVEAHLSRLQVCMEAAVPPIGPSASVIGEALERIYNKCGWLLTDVYPSEGATRRRFPRLSEFIGTVEQVIVDRKYEGEVLSNLKAALVGRFRPLLMGSKGTMFDTPRSSPDLATLFAQPTILELNDLNIDDKSLVVMFVLTFLREYRELEFTQRDIGSGPLAHVTLVEEAHNVLENVASKGGGEGATSADTRYKAVEAFCQLLTEIRALGEGLLIADQSPEKLAPDAMRNTNLQIAHQLRDGNDRNAVANAMIMTDEQRDFLGKLRPGQAAVFRTGLERATFVSIPQYYPTPEQERRCPTSPPDARRTYHQQFRGWGYIKALTDDRLIQMMGAFEPELRSRQLPVPFSGCSTCQCRCKYRDGVAVEFDIGGGWESTRKLQDLIKSNLKAVDLWKECARIAENGACHAGYYQAEGAQWCYFVHMWHDNFTLNPTFPLTPERYNEFHKFLSVVRREAQLGE